LCWSHLLGHLSSGHEIVRQPAQLRLPACLAVPLQVAPAWAHGPPSSAWALLWEGCCCHLKSAIIIFSICSHHPCVGLTCLATPAQDMRLSGSQRSSECQHAWLCPCRWFQCRHMALHQVDGCCCGKHVAVISRVPSLPLSLIKGEEEELSCSAWL